MSRWESRKNTFPTENFIQILKICVLNGYLLGKRQNVQSQKWSEMPDTYYISRYRTLAVKQESQENNGLGGSRTAIVQRKGFFGVKRKSSYNIVEM